MSAQALVRTATDGSDAKLTKAIYGQNHSALTKSKPNQVLFEDTENGITYRIMTPADAEATLPMVAQAFKDGEPTTGAGGATLKDFEVFCEMYVPPMAEAGLSVLAVDTATGNILGAHLNEDYSTPDPPELEAYLAAADGNWEPTFTMIMELEEKFNSDWGIPEVKPAGKWLHMWLLAVGPESKGKGIGSKLVCLTVEMAKGKGYLCAFGECTGGASTHLMTKYTGASVDMFIDYATWNGCDTAHILRQLPAQGHRGMSLTVNRF